MSIKQCFKLRLVVNLKFQSGQCLDAYVKLAIFLDLDIEEIKRRCHRDLKENKIESK